MELQSKIQLNLREYLADLKKLVDVTEKTVKELTGEEVNIGIDAEGLSSVKKEIESLEKDVEVKAKANDSEIKGVKKQIDDIDGTEVNVKVNGDTSALSGITDALGGGLVGGLVGGGLVGLATEGLGMLIDGFSTAINLGKEFNTALGDLQAKTGATADEMERLEEASKKAFLDGVGDSVAEATQIIGNAQINLGDIFSIEEIGKFTVQAQALAKTFDLDVNEVLTKATPLVKQYGLTGQEAFDLIAFSLQEGSTAQADALDSVAEYSQQLQEAGFSAQDLGKFIAQAGEDGQFGTDKLLDSIKETQ